MCKFFKKKKQSVYRILMFLHLDNGAMDVYYVVFYNEDLKATVSHN